MPGLVIHQSNHVETLAGVLADALSAYARDPLTPVTIVVQSRGMERWLGIELAQRLGLVANIRFPFPNTILQEIFTAVMPASAPNGLFDIAPLTFRVMKTLPGCLAEEAFVTLMEYVSTSSADLHLFQLCQKISGMYDQLATYRPELIRAWDQGEFETWHGCLWHRMLEDAERQAHRPALFHQFSERIQQWQGPLPGIPEKLFLFGISTLPALHLEALAAVSAHSEVQIFLMNPCQEFWHDIASDKTQLKVAKKTGTAGEEALPDLHYERGHPLLASLGTLSQEFLNLLQDYNPECTDHFQKPGTHSALAILQTQLLELTDPAAAERQLLAPGDQSVQIHSCHSPVREVEALRDALLRHLDDDPQLEPREILVMAPDIEVYAPYITAVFAGESLEKQKIPFSIADRSRRKESPVAEAFLKLLALQGARLTASQILELLEEPTIRNRFGLSLDDLDLIRQWVHETRICWGIDGAFKERFALPASDNNTWQAGFDRLFLGYALPAEEQALFEGILPYDDIEGSNAEVLGRFSGFCRQLFNTVEAFAQSRTLADWGSFLSDLVEAFLQTDAKDELINLSQHICRFAHIENLSGYAERIDFEVLRSTLARELSLASTSGFLRGGVTFCSLLPMRSIPFKVIALLGMNDAAFPRKSPSVSFDLMSQQPRRGDPSRRKEDRYLFLEALLAARKSLIITYLGQNMRDNSEAPPSVVVCELIDALNQSFRPTAGSELRDHFVVRHRLQGFSPAYFCGDQRLFSYSHDNFQGAHAIVSDKTAPPDFMQGGLDQDGEGLPNVVTLAQLVDFLQNPARYFLRNRLGIFLDHASTTLQDQEPFRLDGLTGYQIAQDMVETLLDASLPPRSLDLYVAKSVLPQGGFAVPSFEYCAAAARDFARKVQAFTQGQPPATCAFDQTFGAIRLTGELTGLYPQGLLRYRCAGIRPKDRLATWIHHLAFCSVARGDAPAAARSQLLGSNQAVLAYNFVAGNRQILASLLELFQTGQTQPLPFFPRAAFSYSEARLKGLSPEKCLDKARSEWLDSDYRAGESQDQDFDFCFGRLDPIDATFEELAYSIVEPLLNHQAKV